jgi:hypothetical protein
MGKHKRPRFYRLEGHVAVPCTGSYQECAMMFSQILGSERHIAEDEGPGWRLSTIFLGMDHNHHALAMNLPVKQHPPLLFETAFFRKIEGCEILARYTTWEQALTGHNHVLACLKSDSGAQ